MITIKTKVRKIRTGKAYTVIKLFGPYAEIEKVNRKYIEIACGMTEYVYLTDIEEWTDDRIIRDASDNTE